MKLAQPALLTSTSMGPKARTAVVTAASRCPASVTSASIGRTRSSPSDRASSLSLSPERATATIRAPARWYSSALARPIPPDAPVINTTRSFRSYDIGPPFRSQLFIWDSHYVGDTPAFQGYNPESRFCQGRCALWFRRVAGFPRRWTETCRSRAARE